jgi:hypothetical protein
MEISMASRSTVALRTAISIAGVGLSLWVSVLSASVLMTSTNSDGSVRIVPSSVASALISTAVSGAVDSISVRISSSSCWRLISVH